jgi:DNA-binding LacI/PurR family transcriptional regulator
VAGARAVIGELLAAGHRNICVLLYPPGHTSTIEDRLEGYAQELAAAGIPLHRSLLYVEDGLLQLPASWLLPDTLIDRLAAFLRRKSEVTAIFATNAGLALLARYAAERLGWRVPDDLSIASIDAVECLPLTVPAVTCALQQEEEIGATAIALLQEQLSGGPPRRVMLPMQVRRAGSVAAPRASVPHAVG